MKLCLKCIRKIVKGKKPEGCDECIPGKMVVTSVRKHPLIESGILIRRKCSHCGKVAEEGRGWFKM